MSEPQDQSQSSQDEAELQALLRDDTPDVMAVIDEVADKPADKVTPADDQPAAQSVEVKPELEQVAPKGDARAALRASRRSEHRLRQDVSRLQEQLTQAQSAMPAAAASDDDLSPEDIEQANDFPLVAKLMRQNKALSEKFSTLEAQAQTLQTPAAAEFIPPTLPPELQDVVDDIPQLLGWQNDPNQAAFELAKLEDQKLLLIPKWQRVTAAERFAEVARRVAADLNDDAPAPAKPRFNVDDQIAKADRVRPTTLGDIGGGGGETPKADSTLSRFRTMSDEDIEAELLSG